MPVIHRLIETYKVWDASRNKIPKPLRFTLGIKIENLFLDILELLFIASYLGKTKKLPVLVRANSRLDVLKFFLQITWEMKAIDTKKFGELSQALAEIGKMLGGWRKGIESKLPPSNE